MVELGPYRSADARPILEDRLAQSRYRRDRARFLQSRQSVELLTVALFFWELFGPIAWCGWRVSSGRFSHSLLASLWLMAETVLLALLPLLGFVALARRLAPCGLLSTAARVTGVIAALIGAAECALMWGCTR